MSNSKFTRIARVDEQVGGAPDYMQHAFIPQEAPAQEDEFAYLRRTAAERQAKIARQASSTSRQVRAEDVTPHDWEQISGQSVYQEQNFRPVDERMSNLHAHDVSGQGVRRVGAGVDNDLSARSLVDEMNIQWGTTDDYMTAMMRGASIWDAEMEYITEELKSDNISASLDRKASTSKQRLSEERARKNEDWQKQALAGIVRPRNTVLARANEAVRSGFEGLSAGRFGLPEYDDLFEAEDNRMTRSEESRLQRLAIKAKGKTREEQHNDWERSVKMRSAASMQDEESNLYAWADNLIGEKLGPNYDG